VCVVLTLFRAKGPAQLVITEDRWVVRRYNDTGHLGGLTAAAAPPT